MNGMKKATTAIVSFGLMTSILAGCGSNADKEVPAASEMPKEIAVIKESKGLEVKTSSR